MPNVSPPPPIFISKAECIIKELLLQIYLLSESWETASEALGDGDHVPLEAVIVEKEHRSYAYTYTFLLTLGM